MIWNWLLRHTAPLWIQHIEHRKRALDTLGRMYDERTQ